MGLGGFPRRVQRGSQSVGYELGSDRTRAISVQVQTEMGLRCSSVPAVKPAYVQVHKVNFKSTLVNHGPVFGFALPGNQCPNSRYRPNAYSTFASRQHPFPERRRLRQQAWAAAIDRPQTPLTRLANLRKGVQWPDLTTGGAPAD